MISIIVPVYNSADYLEDCIESIYRQLYPDWECILIDDGSSDGSARICDAWTKIDRRFRVFHQLNSGVSTARNTGIKYALGEYITFIDSDDWVDDNYLSALIATGGESDLIVSGIIDCYADGRSVVCKPCTSAVIDIIPQFVDVLTDLLKKNLLYGPTNKLYKSDIIRKHNIGFPIDCSLGEDLVFNFTYLDYVRTIETVSEAHYNYRRIPSGSLSTKVSYDKFKNDYHHWQLRFNFFKNKNLLTDSSKAVLMKLLWGVLYDGIFRYESLGYPSIQYLKFLNKIQEIDLLQEYTSVFNCSPWIKHAILNRRYLILFMYFHFQRLFRI